jgi:hypothetical protein
MRRREGSPDTDARGNLVAMGYCQGELSLLVIVRFQILFLVSQLPLQLPDGLLQLGDLGGESGDLLVHMAHLGLDLPDMETQLLHHRLGFSDSRALRALDIILEEERAGGGGRMRRGEAGEAWEATCWISTA